MHDKTSILFNQNINDIDYNTIVELNLNLINEDMPDNKFDKLIISMISDNPFLRPKINEIIYKLDL